MSWLSKNVSSAVKTVSKNALPIAGFALGGTMGAITGGIVKNNLYKAQDVKASTDQPSPDYLNPQQQMAQGVAAHAFSSFGYNASPEELASFSAIYHSENGGNALQVDSAVSNYIQTKQRFQELNSNDPTQQVMADEKGFFNATQAKAAGYEKDASGVYQQMANLASQAPKLFGGLSEDQIKEYLAPVERQAREQNSLLQGQAAARGLAGSSTELNALADANSKYKENVLNTGLDLGLKAQGTQLNIMGNRQNQLFGAGQNAYNLLPGTLNSEAQLATNRQNNLTDEANYLNQLPLFLQSANPAPAMPAPTGSKNFFAPGQPGTALLQAAPAALTLAALA